MRQLQAGRCWLRSSMRGVLALMVVLVMAVGAPQSFAQEAPRSRAAELIKNRQYNDAIRVLKEEIQGKPEEQCGKQFLMLGECNYLSRNYESAKDFYTKASKNLGDGPDKIVAEYRLGCAAYRLKDAAGALALIDAFVAKHPADSHVGKLLVFKMGIRGGDGKDAQKDMETLHDKVYADIKKYDYATGMEADELLCDFYRAIGQDDKAQGVYAKIVHNFRQVIADLEKDKQPIPAGFEKAHDNAALQLGMICLEKKQPQDAVKWLENVRYDAEMKLKARLLLAKAAYERQDYSAAAAYLSEKGFLDGVAEGPVKSDMYLMLGLCEKAKADWKPDTVQKYLSKVSPDTRGYFQAQSVLGDAYREKGLLDDANKAYTKALQSAEYAPTALFYIGSMYMDQGAKADAAHSNDFYRKAADPLGQLLTKYPLSSYAKQAKEKAAILANKGIMVAAGGSGEDMRKGWEKTAAEKKGTMEAAQALMSLVRFHSKTVVDEKTKKVTQAANYAASAAACDQLLDEKVYTGTGFSGEAWKSLRAEALYERGLCELASIGKTDDAAIVKGATAEKAAGFLSEAKRSVDAKQLDMVKGIELGLLEAMFKSEKKETKEAAEKRFAELEGDYGTDPRFQKLSIGLAEWYVEQGKWVDGAKQYIGVAERGRELSDDDRLRLLHMGGSLYTKAGYEAQQKAGQGAYAIYIYPKETIDVGDSILKTHGPFSKTIDMKWGRDGISARDALLRVSTASKIPFVWSTAKGPNTINAWLGDKKVSLKDGKYTVEQALSAIFDPQFHRFVLDIGLTDGKPTIEAVATDKDDPEAADKQLIEIYDVRTAGLRYKPLGQNYGAWKSVHAKTAILYNVIQRVEELTKTRVLWAEDVEKQEKLAFEYKKAPGFGDGEDVSCARVLTGSLEPLGLRFKVIRREVASEYYEAAKDAFNKVRKIDPRSKYGERALFTVALNYYNQRDYVKMKTVLKEYLKVFDSPSNEFYQQACFWVGWAFENEKKYREAVNYYARSAEERLVIYKPKEGEKALSKEELKNRLSSETLYTLSEPVAGTIEGLTLEKFADFIRLNTHVGVRVDAAGADATIDRAAFKGVPGIDVLYKGVTSAGMGIRVENVNQEYAEKAYFRQAVAYKKDEMMEQALESCNLLLDRYPNSSRRRDATKVMLGIYKGLKDYGSVQAKLGELEKTAQDPIEKRELKIELASIRYDLADYSGAAGLYKGLLDSSVEAKEKQAIQDGYARSLFRSEKTAEALEQYEAMLKEDAEPMGRFVDGLMAFYLKFALGKSFERELPEEAQQFILAYEKHPDSEINNVSTEEAAKATWVYYISGLIDLKKDRTPAAIAKFTAAAHSPDDALAGEALYQRAMAFVRTKDFAQAQEYLSDLVVVSHSSETAVRATYQLGVCLQELNKPQKALAYFERVVKRYPGSPLANLAEKNTLYQAAHPKAATTQKQ